VLVLLVRFSISRMDVPTRQSYLMAVTPGERSAAAGITGVAVGIMFAQPAIINVPFFAAGLIKIGGDLTLPR